MSNASDTYPLQASAIKKGAHAVMKGHPCKVIETSTSKTGKHGHAKVHMVGLDIFTNKKYEEISPSTHNMSVPNVTRNEYMVIDVTEDGFVSLLLDSGDTKDDLKLPEGQLGDDIRAAFDDGKEVLVTVVAAMGNEQIMTFKANA